MKNQFLSLHLDFVGFATSLICAIHCALFPLFLSIIPLVGFQILGHPWIEFSIIFLSLTFASVALGKGFRTHFNKLPLLIVSFGFLMICLGHFFESSFLGIIMLTLGAFIIAFAHYLNWKYVKKVSSFSPHLIMKKDLNRTENKNKKAA